MPVLALMLSELRRCSSDRQTSEVRPSSSQKAHAQPRLLRQHGGQRMLQERSSGLCWVAGFWIVLYTVPCTLYHVHTVLSVLILLMPAG